MKRQQYGRLRVPALPESTVRGALALAMAVLLIFLIVRGSGIYPVVFADEWAYSSYSRLLPLSQAGVPSYLYLLVFRSTSVCGDGFLECARLLNSLFLVLTVPLIYGVARRVTSPAAAAAVALVSVGGAFSTYAIYFMPESLYFLGFWLLTWFLLRDGSAAAPALHALLAGALLGALSLVKVHALFLAPALACFLVYQQRARGDAGWLRNATLALVLAVGAFLVVKFGAGYLSAGRNGVTLFGSLYGAQADGASLAHRIRSLADAAAGSLAGHLMALCFMFGVPVAALLSRVSSRANGSGDQANAAEAIRLYSMLVLVPLVVVTAAFTASVEGSGPLETAGRLHMRYYNFALPLMLIVAATELAQARGAPLCRWFAALVVSATAVLAFAYLLSGYTPSMVDSPELRGISRHPHHWLTIGIAGVLASLLWAANARWGARMFIFVLAPVVALVGTWEVGHEVRQRQAPDVYEDASRFAKRHLGPQASRLVVVAPHPAPLLRALFHIDNPSTQAHQQAEGTPLDLARLRERSDWALLIGRYALPADLEGMALGQFSLLQLAPARTLDFRRSDWPGVVRSQGLSQPEPWGTWSQGPEVLLEFGTSLPRRYRLNLRAHAFGPNIGAPMVLHLGDSRHELRLGQEPQELTIDGQNPGNEKIVRIEVPHPVAPVTLGVGDDTRRIGLAIGELRITDLNQYSPP